MKQTLTALAITLLLAAAHAEADAAFRCPNGNLVDTGDSMSVVSSKCDAPASVSSRTVPVETVKGRIRYDEVQEWLYTAGSTLTHTLLFVNGVLVSVTTGGFVR